MGGFDERMIFSIERPTRRLLQYYTLCCLFSGPLFPILFLPYYFKYHTMRYRFDQEGISMRWGILFRREIILNYSRIQDIHLISNVLERWLGLARLQIQTASGSSSAEMTIEGIECYEAVRDFLYSRMRGQKEKGPEARGGAETDAPRFVSPQAVEQLTCVLREVAGEIHALRQSIESLKK